MIILENYGDETNFPILQQKYAIIEWLARMFRYSSKFLVDFFCHNFKTSSFVESTIVVRPLWWWNISAARYGIAFMIILENFHNNLKFAGKFIYIVKSFLKKKKSQKLSYLESFMLIISHSCTKLTWK